MSCISQEPLELNFFKFSSRDTVFFMEICSQKKTGTPKQEICVTQSSTLCLFEEHGPTLTELSGTGKGTGSYNPHAEHPPSCT